MGISTDSIEKKFGRLIGNVVFALTRHEVNGQPIGHIDAIKKVMKAHRRGVPYARVIKLADRTENVRDQTGVARPLVDEEAMRDSDDYRKSPYGKWRKTKERTETVFTRKISRHDIRYATILTAAINKTVSEINHRPRRSIYEKAA